MKKTLACFMLIPMIFARTVQDPRSIPELIRITAEYTVTPGEESRPVYVLENYKQEYMLVTIVPEKIYWNNSRDFSPAVGEPLNILLPAALYESVKDADSLILHFDEYNSLPYQEDYRFSPKNTAAANSKYDNFIAGLDWEEDDLYVIKDGVLMDIDIKGLFGDSIGYFLDSSIMLDYDPDCFGYGLTVEEIDKFLDDTHRHRLETEKEADEMRRELDDPSYNVDCDYVSYSFFLEGTEMRARLEK